MKAKLFTVMIASLGLFASCRNSTGLATTPPESNPLPSRFDLATKSQLDGMLVNFNLPHFETPYLFRDTFENQPTIQPAFHFE
jgi:hypothetical protein